MNSAMRKFSMEPVWQPNENSGEIMKIFMRKIENKYSLHFGDYWDLHKWSVENIGEFWAEIWNFFGIIYSKPYDMVIDLNTPMEESPKWFEGARLNYAENLLRFRDDHIALILAGEDREVERLSFKQLYEETRVYAAALRKIRLEKGDKVTCYMSNRKEAVVAMLAATSMGAIWTACLPSLEPQKCIDRLKQVQPKVLFTVDQFTFSKKTHNLLKNIKTIAEGMSSLEKIVIVPSRPKSSLKDISEIRNSCYLDDFLANAENPDGSVPAMMFEQVSFSHPVFISFTSGTTGLPKCIVHGFGGLLSSIRDAKLHANRQRSNVYLSITQAGWAGWNYACNYLFIGLTLVLFEGFPFTLSRTYLWDMIDNLKITVFLTTPQLLDVMEAENCLPSEKHHLSSLSSIGAGGGVIKNSNYEFVEKIKQGVKLYVGYGCTEMMVICLVADDTLTLHRGEIPSPALGVSLECLNEKGNLLLGEMGDLVISKPMPSLPLGLWGDIDGGIFKKSYFSKYPGKFTIGDVIIINPKTKGIIVCGRSDETIKKQGCRFASSEIYTVVKMFPEIHDSLCVGQSTTGGDERAVLFTVMKKGHSLKDDLIKRIQIRIEKDLTALHVPEVIVEAPGIPYNANGKKTEIIVKKIINKMPNNSESVANPECLQFYYEFPE